MLQTVGAGMVDFVSQSSQGNVFGGGLSLAQHVTHGVADTASKLTGSMYVTCLLTGFMYVTCLLTGSMYVT